MAFFARQPYNTNASFNPLFRLLDEFDNYSGQATRQSNIPHWQPKFDIRETEQAYEFHGEFPGVKKEDVNIEFTDPQTVVIRGKTERTYNSGTPSADTEDVAVTGATTDGTDEKSETASHRATVEDEFESVSHETEETTEKPEAQVAKQEQQPAPKKPANQAKYWLTERSIGEFSRSFSFPTQIDQEAVTANFKDGILTIVVPKAKKHESRRIAVN